MTDEYPAIAAKFKAKGEHLCAKVNGFINKANEKTRIELIKL